jgi:hypothetical protein
MELDMVNATASAARAARTTLAGLARGGNVDEPRMAKIAQAAIFEEALLSALHARLNELRSVAK